MPEPEGYTSIRLHEDARDSARAVKSELELTWSEFAERAAESLKESNS